MTARPGPSVPPHLAGALVPGVDPADPVGSVAAGVSARQPYADPAPAVLDDAVAGLARLVDGDLAGAAGLLGGLGFTVTADFDPVTWRPYALAVSETRTERAWGVYLVDLSEPRGLCVAVPHPKFDAVCERLAVRLWRAVPGTVLALAAVHRNALVGTGPRIADQARDTGSVFHRLWTSLLGPRGLPQVQIHGFADTTAREQVVVSTGVGPPTATAERIADRIAATGRATTRSWDGTADPDLRATTNEQGIAAAAAGWVWAHIEFDRTVRTDPELWEPAIDAVAAADPALSFCDRPR
ncbi:MAG: hypothetical protein ACJ73E_06735 [Mycobacteriales bacterium]